MKKILTKYGALALAVALMVPLAQAQSAGIQTAFGKDAGTLSDKFTGLARVMSGKYEWKPGQGVRSVDDAGSSEGFLRQPAKSDYGTFRKRPAGAGETV